MTSTVTCQTDVGVDEIFSALFPCASITGAPKIRTMQIIDELEDAPRGVYTGAIGWMFPGKRARFNVAIRTLTLDPESGRAVYPVGSGILWDSDADAEYSECLLKARVLGAESPFEILETILLEDGTMFLRDRHIKRALASSAYFGYPLTREVLATACDACESEHSVGRFRVRMLIDASGSVHTEATKLVSEETTPFILRMDTEATDTRNVFCRHKTTRREIYEDARSRVADCDDVVLWNNEGYLTETTIANILVEREGEWLTPPISEGLLRAHSARNW